MIFLDLVGTITDPESERGALIQMAREIKRRFHLPESPGDIWEEIEDYRRPYMESRDAKYIPIRYLIASGTAVLLEKHGMSMDLGDTEWVKELYVSAHERFSALSGNALRGLEVMRDISEHLGVISDADDDYLKRVLKALGIHEFFDSITSSEEAGVCKPNPKIFETAMEKAGMPENAYYVGDSERRDIEGAVNVGMTAVLVSGKDVRGSSAYHIAHDLYDAAVWISNRKDYKGT